MFRTITLILSAVFPSKEAIVIALRQEGVFRVSAVVDIDNPASCRVLEKCGFHREGIMRRGAIHPNISTETRDVFVYAKCRD